MELISHPMRTRIVAEMHLRRLPPVPATSRILQLVRLVEPADRDLELKAIRQFAEAAGNEGQVYARHGRGRTRQGTHWIWERHSEASTLTLITPGGGPPFALDRHDAAARHWLESSPGLVIRAVRIAVEPDDLAAALAVADLDEEDLISCHHQRARIWSDFKVHGDDWGRLVIASNEMDAADLGRLIQRVQELGNYRNLALLALPMVQAQSAQLDQLEAAMVTISNQLTATSDEQAMLDEISRLSAEVAGLTAASAFRLGAMDAYAGIVADRLRDLACDRIEGFQRLDDFIDRRLTPAVRTGRAFAGRLEALSTRLERATALLRTRIEMRVQAQNTVLLASVERTGSRQLKLQHLVEGLSVVAVSYYAFGLLTYALKPLAARASVSLETAQALALPGVILAVWIYLGWRIRQLDSSQA